VSTCGNIVANQERQRDLVVKYLLLPQL